MAGSRPLGVTLIGFLIVVEGILGIIAAVMGLFSFGDDSSYLWSSIILGIISIIYLAVAKGLFNGSGGARLILALITVIALINGLFALIFIGGLRIQGLVQSLIAVIVLLVLYSPRAKLFFK